MYQDKKKEKDREREMRGLHKNISSLTSNSQDRRPVASVGDSVLFWLQM